MFSRKRASSNPPRLVKTVPSAAASTAATQAFLANRNSNANLSSAAAAAALRSQTTSPFSVGQIQTKRMQRRGSASSNGSAPERPGLRRQGSSGSMTERTFRDPSPGRPASSHGPYARQDQPPPVPALPKTYAPPVSMPRKAAQRAASVEPPERVSSPPPRLAGGGGVSRDRGPGNYKPNNMGAKAGVLDLPIVGEPEQAGSRGSVNFSRPMSPTNSPPASPLTGGRVRSPPPTKVAPISSLPSREIDRIMESIQETADRPVKKKQKKSVTRDSAEGSHLAIGVANGPSLEATSATPTQRQVASTTSTPSRSNTVPQPSSINEAQSAKKKKKKISSAGDPQAQETGEGFESAYHSDTDSVISERSTTTDRSRNLNNRAVGMLAKQPSIVREDREAEEQEEKQISAKKIDGQMNKNDSVFAGTPANTSKIVSKERQHNRSASQQVALQGPKRTSLDIPGTTRPQSLSPARAAHFSSQPEYETLGGTKHQPPARSVSPAKSALKHSPSRGHSPVGVIIGSESRRQGLAGSEASDTASNISDDGSRTFPKKKKTARVSFDEDSVAVGRAASPPLSPDSPVILSPQSKPKSRSWLDLVRERNQESSLSELDQDNIIKPTPTLPSFGRARNRKGDLALDPAEEQEPRRDWENDTLRSMNASTDQRVGGLLLHSAATKTKNDGIHSIPRQGPADPLPPKVTSVEGTGYQSDEEITYVEQQRVKYPATEEVAHQTSKDASSKDLATSDMPLGILASELPSANVPSISLQPATPALETGRSERTSWLGMPGGFPSASQTTENPGTSSVSVADTGFETTPATVGTAEPEQEATAAQPDQATPLVGGVAEGLRTQIESQIGEESEDSGGSIYSDAAEDPDDLEGDGFGSINAIIESPAVSPLVAVAGKPAPVSPIIMAPIAKTVRPRPLARNESELSEPGSDAGWHQAQAYWSGLSQTRREQLEQAAAPGALEKSATPKDSARVPEVVQKTKKKIPKKSTLDTEKINPALPPWPDKQYRNDIATPASLKIPPPKSSKRVSKTDITQETQMRSSMRNEPDRKSALKNGGRANDTQEIHMRSSMRNGPPLKSASRKVDQKKSVQLHPEPRSAFQKMNRPVSAVAMIDYNKPHALPAPHHSRAASTGTPVTSLAPVPTPPKIQKQITKPSLGRNDSDSSSSYKKARSPTPNSNSGRYIMKRTMRPSSGDARPQSPSTAQSLSGRTSSPTSSMARRPFSSVGPNGSGMRTSTRDSADLGKPGRAILRGSADLKRPKSPSRFGFGKASKPKAADPKPRSHFSSRFEDSSDEEDGRPNLRSRFADSSDDEPADFAPVRGIPKRIDEGDSTDLEDSSVENSTTSLKPKVNGAKASATTKPEGLALATGSLRAASDGAPTAVMGSGLQAKKAAEKESKKRSFFGSLGSKKRDSPSVVKTDPESAVPGDMALERSKTETHATLSSKGERVLGPTSPKADPISLQPPTVGSQTSTAQSSPKSPKLQRRNTPKRLASANNTSWPLAQNPGGAVDAVDDRPRTSDGQAKRTNAAAARPDLGTRRSTVQGKGADVSGASVPVTASGKKRRFPMLRKAFGLHE